MNKTELQLYLSKTIAQELGIAPAVIEPTTNLVHYGLNSLHAITLAGTLEANLKVKIDFATLVRLNTLENLVVYIDNASNTKRCHSLSSHIVTNTSQLVPYREAEINNLDSSGLYFCTSDGLPTPYITIQGQELLNFSSYNYLGFAHDSDIINAAISAIHTYGTSASASRLVGGQRVIHNELERAIAQFLGTEDALVFNSGHATNVSTIGHLMTGNDLILLDELSHNSLVQGAQLSGATLKFFTHNDADSLYELLAEYSHQYEKTLVVTEGVFSMDGDISPLHEYIALKQFFQFFLYVDEAHSLGVLGDSGAGIGEYYTINRADVDIWMGTLSKALASCGGYIAGSHRLINYLKYTAPAFVYSCGLSPADTAAALAALAKLNTEGTTRLHHLQTLSRYLISELHRRLIDTGLSQGTPIIPILLGDAKKAISLCTALRRKNIYLTAIVAPAVPEELSRLRIFLNHAHSKEQIDYLVAALDEELILINHSECIL